MHHFLAEDVESTLTAVLEACDPSPAKQNVVGGVLHAIPLHGDAVVNAWQKRASAYPDELRARVLEAHAPIEFLWQLDAYAARANPVRGHALLAHVHEQLLHSLLALNRRYYVGFKSLDSVAEDLPLAPPDLLRRIRDAYPLVFGRTRELVRQLVEDTYDLIDEHVPELDVARWRGFLRYDRPLWDRAENGRHEGSSAT